MEAGMTAPQPGTHPETSIHPTPEYRFDDADGDKITVETITDPSYRDGRQGHVEVGVISVFDGSWNVIHVPPSEAHVLAAAILAHAYPETTAMAINLNDFRIAHADPEGEDHD
jgi:hypothetical protein